jgi:hypothetical protein
MPHDERDDDDTERVKWVLRDDDESGEKWVPQRDVALFERTMS